MSGAEAASVYAAAIEAAKKPGQKFTPPDDLFVDPDRGQVVEAKTPSVMVGTLLAERFEIVGYIESGSFGRGWRATDKEQPGKHVFIKTFRSAQDRPTKGNASKHEEMVKKEIDTELAKTSLPFHPSLVNAQKVCYGSVTVPKNGKSGAMFFMHSPDLCEGGELYNYLVFTKNNRMSIRSFSENHARKIFTELAHGVQHMHKNGFFHRDLKLENAVLTDDYKLKIMDFGHAKQIDLCKTSVDSDGNKHAETSTFVGTASYQPPELNTKGASYDPAAFDSWSCGVVLFFLVGIESLAAKGVDFMFISKLRSRGPFRAFLDAKYKDNKVPWTKADMPAAPANLKLWQFFQPTPLGKVSPELKNLLNGMLNADSKKRFKMDDIINHPWMTKEELPSQEDFAKDMTGRYSFKEKLSKGKKFTLSNAKSQEEAVKLMLNTIKKIPGYADQHSLQDTNPYYGRSAVSGNQIFVGTPEAYRVTVGPQKDVEISWMAGRLEPWLDFQFALDKMLGLNK
jgi:serine/threonine protein kinase